MSLETAISKAVFQGNGAATEFSFSFKVWDTSELIVLVAAADGSLQDVTAQCSIALSDIGGTVTYAQGGSPLPKGQTLTILRNMPFLQEIKLISGTRFDPAVIEEALDKAAAERQQLLEKVNRAVVVPADSEDPPETLADQLFEARDRAEAAAGRSASSEAEAKRQADRAEREASETAQEVRKATAQDIKDAKAQADRARKEADRAAQAVIIGVRAENLEAVWALEADVEANGTLELPLSYFAGRNMLHLSYEGVELYPGPHYEEIGAKDELSSSVKMLFPLTRGMVMHAWAVASNVARNVEEAEARAKAEADRAAQTVQDATAKAVKDATEQADKAKAEANRAADTVKQATTKAVSDATAQADRAEDAADRAETARNVAQNAAQEATEQADRADEAAGDAAQYRKDVYAAARCVAVNLKSRALASVREEELLSKVPSGFFVINEEIVVPGTIKQPLTPVDRVENIPTTCDGFYLLVPPFENDCPPEEQEPVKPQPSQPNYPAGNPSWMLPCGKRVRI